MKDVKYIYNPKTCQYERARLTWRDIVLTGFGILFTATLLFIGIVVLHNRFVTSDYERQLRAENKLLKEHKPVLMENLNEIETTLQKLKSEEKDLYTKLFNTTPPSEKNVAASLSKEKVLLADAGDFQSMLETLKGRSDALYDRTTDSHAATRPISEQDLAMMLSLPSILPIQNLEAEKLVSGFGKRVNPFHKGMYLHPGVDFIATRGTEVVATAPGEVNDINKNELQAGYGNSIVIDHGHGMSTRYAHLETITVRPGQKVTKGMVIGTVGSTGGSVAPHLHYEVIRDGEHVDPSLYFIEGITSRQHHQLLERSKQSNQSLD
ncbi:MAG TPA: M23 family metallopeptidase [Ohtaekwangia sp.]|uniref:M23 family metallopeptidase n=1 Tax=Ohtaekwangia sp. TaxID=2066019 RepID=UPI002F92AC27